MKRRHWAYLNAGAAVFRLGAAGFDQRLRYLLLAAGYGLVALLIAKGWSRCLSMVSKASSAREASG